MNPKRLFGRLFGRSEQKVRPPQKSEAEQARELERTIQAGIAMNKFPPR
jgi:hypothetical protein